MPTAKLGWYWACQTAHQCARINRVVRPRDLIEQNVPHAWLYVVGGPDFDKIGRGLYVFEGDTPDPLIIMARKHPRLTLGLTSALWLHGLLPRPARDWWVMGNKDRKPSLPSSTARFVRSTWPQEDHVELRFDRTWVSGHSIERSLIECVRFERHLGRDAVIAAFRAAAGRFSIDELHARAGQLHALAPLRALMRTLADPR